jgi:type I restriction enzyme M protein
MAKTIKELFEDFEVTYKADKNFSITPEWYKKELGVISFNKSAPTLNTKGNFSEEYVRARFVYSLINSNKFSRENICVEAHYPKGNGGKSINPDIIVFKDKDWAKSINSMNDFVKLKESILVIFEAKKDNKSDISTIIQKQLVSALSEYQHPSNSTDLNVVYGVYFDDKEDILIFKKESTFQTKRFNQNKIKLDGDKNWNVGNRDSFSDLPSFSDFITGITKFNNISNFIYTDLRAIDEEVFNDNLVKINRLKDNIGASNVSKYIVEFLTFKIIDEKMMLKDTTRKVKFYKLQNESHESFKKRMFELQNDAEKEFHNILVNRMFGYVNDGNDIILREGLDEKIELFFIEVVKIFQEYSILQSKNQNFNQIIFNNFGANSDKGEHKQFFTPVPIVDLIINMLNPQPNELVCDPTAGICDFLAMSFKKVFGKTQTNVSELARNLYGFDIDEDVVKLAELNLILNGDGGANITKVKDSLTCKMTLDKKGIINPNEFTTDNYTIEDWKKKGITPAIFTQFDVIATNPPFGKGRDLKLDYKKGGDSAEIPENTIKLYETYWFKSNPCYDEATGKFLTVSELKKQAEENKIKLSFPNSMDKGALFLENAVKSLKKGGRMAIVLSSSLASIEEWKNVRAWFMSKMRLVGVIDLPSGIFGETGVSTTILLAYKPKDNSILDTDYKIFTREIDNVGYEIVTKDRMINFKPVFKINEQTFEIEKDLNGDNIILEDISETIRDFGLWLVGQEVECKEAFHVKQN